MPSVEIRGVNIYYDVFGEGPNVVFCLPGFLGTIEEDFGKVIDQMDKTVYKVVSWDPPGYGRSQPFYRKFEETFLEEDALYAADLMEKLGFDRYSVLGWSQGGATGIYLAGNHPSRVICLATSGTTTVTSVITSVKLWPKERLDCYLKYYDMEHLEKLLSDYKRRMGDMGIEWKFSKRHLDKLKCPLLIMHAQNDTSAPLDGAHYLHSIYPKSKLHVFPKGGHDVHLQFTELYLGEVLAFLEEHQINSTNT